MLPCGGSEIEELTLWCAWSCVLPRFLLFPGDDAQDEHDAKRMERLCLDRSAAHPADTIGLR